jgi:hypothetical protein
MALLRREHLGPLTREPENRRDVGGDGGSEKWAGRCWRGENVCQRHCGEHGSAEAEAKKGVGVCVCVSDQICLLCIILKAYSLGKGTRKQVSDLDDINCLKLMRRGNYALFLSDYSIRQITR